MSATTPACLDLGNRRLKLLAGVGEPVEGYSWDDAAERERLRARLAELAAPAWLASTSPTGLELLADSVLRGVNWREVRPEDVPLRRTTTGTGVDRLLAAWWAWREVDGAVLVADCGTAFTLDLVDADGVFRGGAIGPGLATAERALAQACPHLDPPAAGEVPALPDNTAAAVAAGTRGALAAAILGLAARMEAELGAAPGARFLTGGDAPRVASALPGWRSEEHLVLRGLARLAAESER